MTPKWSVRVRDGAPSDVAVTLDVRETGAGEAFSDRRGDEGGRRAKGTGRSPRSTDGVKLVLPLSAHLRFVTEAAELKPYLDLPPRTTSAPCPVESSGQFDHEFGKGK